MNRPTTRLKPRGVFAVVVIGSLFYPHTRPMVLSAVSDALSTGKTTAAAKAGGHRPADIRPMPSGSLAGPIHGALTLPSDLPRAVRAARAVRTRYGVPVSVTLGQAMLESGSNLGSGLAREHRNYFGVKCGSGSPYQTGCVRLGTTECLPRCSPVVDGFRAYRSPEASFLDYGRLLNGNRYAAAHRHESDPDAFVRAVAAAGYATAPDYAGRVIRVIDREDLRRWDQ